MTFNFSMDLKFININTNLIIDKQHINLKYIELILVLCGDIELNPGPVQPTVKICHSNIRSLNKENLDHINFDLCPYFDIICLSETNLFKSRKIDFDLTLPGFQNLFHLDRSLCF